MVCPFQCSNHEAGKFSVVAKTCLVSKSPQNHKSFPFECFIIHCKRLALIYQVVSMMHFNCNAISTNDIQLATIAAIQKLQKLNRPKCLHKISANVVLLTHNQLPQGAASVFIAGLCVCVLLSLNCVEILVMHSKLECF